MRISIFNDKQCFVVIVPIQNPISIFDFFNSFHVPSKCKSSSLVSSSNFSYIVLTHDYIFCNLCLYCLSNPFVSKNNSNHIFAWPFVLLIISLSSKFVLCMPMKTIYFNQIFWFKKFENPVFRIIDSLQNMSILVVFSILFLWLSFLSLFFFHLAYMHIFPYIL